MSRPHVTAQLLGQSFRTQAWALTAVTYLTSEAEWEAAAKSHGEGGMLTGREPRGPDRSEASLNV